LSSVQFRTWFEGTYDDDFDYENNFIWGNLLAKNAHPTKNDRDGSGEHVDIVSEDVGGAGLIIMVLSLIIPLVNGIRYIVFKNAIVKSANVKGKEGDRLAFVKDDTFEQLELVYEEDENGHKKGGVNKDFLDKIVPLNIDNFKLSKKQPDTPDPGCWWVTTKDDGKKERLVECGPMDPFTRAARKKEADAKAAKAATKKKKEADAKAAKAAAKKNKEVVVPVVMVEVAEVMVANTGGGEEEEEDFGFN
jgi:hypothetical protein